jgi:hypothetical protein
MFRRALASWRGVRQSLVDTEARLARLVELAEAAAEREAAIAGRIELKLRQLDMLEVHLGRVEHMLTLGHPRFASPLRLERFGRQVCSQNDEDGIIAEIFRRIGATSRTFVEIAAGNGKENCTALLLRQGWRGVWVECGEANVRSIRETWPEQLASGQLKLDDKYISAATVNDVIASGGFGDDIDLLVMDVDGNDYHLLEAMKARPRVLCVEYLGKRFPPERWVLPYDENMAIDRGMADSGASLQSYEDMLGEKGYSLVGSSIAGVNCFFVRSDLVEGKFEAPFTAYNHYNPPRYWYYTLNHMSAIWPGPADGKPPPK